MVFVKLKSMRPATQTMNMNLRRTNMAMRVIKRNNEDEPAQAVSQHKRPSEGRFRLQVDRQTKASHETYEAAEAAGMAIKKGHPILQVAVYDSVESINKIIELPEPK